MKIRTDFVTNSSSSSFVISIRFDLKNGEEILFEADGGNREDGPGEYFYSYPYLLASPRQLAKCSSVDEMIAMLENGVYDDSRRLFKDFDPENDDLSDPSFFINELRKIKDMSEIECIEIGAECEGLGNSEFSQTYSYDTDFGEYRAYFSGRLYPAFGLYGGIGFDDVDKCRIYTHGASYGRKEGTVSATKDGFLVGNGVVLKYVGGKKSPTLPEGIKAIGPYAFLGSGITGITLGDDVVLISNRAFSGCENLQSIVLPKSVRQIQPRTFEGCKSLKSIEIHEGVSRIYVNAFDGCENLVIRTTIRSRADEFAQEHGFKVEYIE